MLILNDTKSEGFPNPTRSYHTFLLALFFWTFALLKEQPDMFCLNVMPLKDPRWSIILSHASFDTRIANFLDPDIGQLLECVENHLPFHVFQLVEHCIYGIYSMASMASLLTWQKRTEATAVLMTSSYSRWWRWPEAVDGSVELLWDPENPNHSVYPRKMMGVVT